QEIPQVPGRDHVREEKTNDVAPDDVLCSYAKVPPARIEVQVVFAPDRGCALVLLDILQVEGGPHVNGIDIETGPELPFDAAARVAPAIEGQTVYGARPMLRIGIGVRRCELIETRES